MRYNGGNRAALRAPIFTRHRPGGVRAARTDACATGLGRHGPALVRAKNAPKRRARSRSTASTPPTAIALRASLHKPSIYRRLPTEVVACHPDLFTFLATNPDVLVDIWRQLGISRVQLRRTGEGVYEFADGFGTTGEMRIVEQDCRPGAQNRVVLYADAAYDGKPFPKPITAQGVFLLQSGSVRESDGKDYVAARLDSFIVLDQTSIELLARAAHPLVGKMADKNFTDSVRFISQMSDAAEVRTDTLIHLASDLPNATPHQQVRLVELVQACHHAGRERAQLGMTGARVRR